jgi:hypothetical protein
VRANWPVFLVLAVAATITVAYAVSAGRPPASRSGPAPTATTSSPATVKPSASPSSSPSPASEVVTVQVSKTTVPADFHYLVLGTSQSFRVVLLDLGATRFVEVARVQVPGLVASSAQPYALVSASNDGRALLLTVVVPEATSSVFLVRPEVGDARPLLRGAAVRSLISPDGSRFAMARNEQDPSLTGLWVGMTSDGSMRRIIADDPQWAGSPPIPYAFSPDGKVLAFGIGRGEIGSQAALVPVDAAESRIERSADDTQATGPDVASLSSADGAQFRTASGLITWSSVNMFGGESVIYHYEIYARTSKELLYRPQGDVLIRSAAWRPGEEQFATRERPKCCGIIPETVWLRGRDGSAKTLGEWTFLGEMWWSSDGSKLYGELGGDDSTGMIMDLLTGTRVMAFCRRGGGPPPAACA